MLCKLCCCPVSIWKYLLLQGLALGMVRCGKRRFDDQWQLIGKMKLRAVRIDCTGCNLPARTFSGVVAF